MTKKRVGEPWMPADEYGRSLPRFSVNLLVREIARALPFYTQVLGAIVHYADSDFAALNFAGLEFMLHADHAYDHHGSHARLSQPGLRGTGAELRVLGADPDALEARAKAAGATILQSTQDYPHGWREVVVADAEGYIWAVGVPLPK
jgi:uncharacterized glyoxalase superfamily protein PhnB